MRENARHGESKIQRHSSRGECDGGIAPGRCVGENHFVREQRTPLAGGGLVVRRAADKFVPASLISDEASDAEGGDKLAACAL